MARADNSDAKKPSADVEQWLSEIKRAEKEFDEWNKRCDTIKKKYTNDGSKQRTRRKYAMLWANTEVLKPSVYTRCPEPAIRSRFKTGDPTTRIAAMLLERGLEFQFDACDYDSSFRSVRDDYLLYARGVPRLRYEPVFEKTEIEDGEDGEDATGEPDAEESEQPDEVVEFETVKLDFVNRKDFIHPFARRWEELPWIAYRAFLTRPELVKRFGEEIGNEIELDASEEKEDSRRSTKADQTEADKATLYEIWDKEKFEVCWIAKSYPEILECGAPYLKLDGFFPSPKPAYATLSTDSLIPVPDYVFYQDQAEEIDDLTARIGALTDSLKLVGFYPAGPQGEGSPEVERAVQPGFENRMVAVKSWDSFKAQGGGGTPIVWLPVDVVAKIIEACVKLRKELVDDVFQITGIADIMRGDTDAEETAAAQGLKAQWGSIRLRERQKELARVARDVTRLAAEIVANHFQVSTLCKISDMPLPTEAEVQQKAQQFQLELAQYRQSQAQAQPNPQGPQGPTAGQGMAAGPQGVSAPPGQSPPPQQPQQPPPQWQDPGPTQEAVEALLRDNISRRFAIDIEADSTIAADEQGDQKRRTEFISEAGKFITGMFPIIQEAPAAAEFIGALFMFGLRAFPAARELEDVAEKMIDKMMAAAGQSKPPSPEDAKASAEIQKAKIGMQTEQMRAQAEVQKAQMDTKAAVLEHQMNERQFQLDAEAAQRDHQMKMAQNDAKQHTLMQTVQQQEQKFAARNAISMFDNHSQEHRQ